MTLATWAVKLALVAPDDTVIEEGTATADLSLARETLMPSLGAAAVRPTLQLSFAEPDTELLPQLNCFSEGDVAVLLPATLK